MIMIIIIFSLNFYASNVKLPFYMEFLGQMEQGSMKCNDESSFHSELELLFLALMDQFLPPH